MEERGFDALQTGKGPAILILSTVLLVLIILVGGMYLRYLDIKGRAARNDDLGRKNDDSQGRPVG